MHSREVFQSAPPDGIPRDASVDERPEGLAAGAEPASTSRVHADPRTATASPPSIELTPRLTVEDLQHWFG